MGKRQLYKLYGLSLLPCELIHLYFPKPHTTKHLELKMRMQGQDQEPKKNTTLIHLPTSCFNG